MLYQYTIYARKTVIIFLLQLLMTHNALPSEKDAYISINLCTDQLLLLFTPSKPVYYSPLAQQPSLNYLAKKVKQSQIIPAQLDRILLASPDKVFASPYSSSYLLHGLARSGITVVTIPIAKDFNDIANNITLLASSIDQQAAGEEITQQLNTQLKAIQKKHQGTRKKSALFYAPNGFTHGDHTIYQSILDHAGLRNLAKERGIQGHGYLPLETVLWYQPDYLILEDDFSNNQSKAQALLSHPALKSPLFKSQLIFVDSQYLGCAGFGSLFALEQITEQL